MKQHLKKWALDPSGWRTKASDKPIHLTAIKDIQNNKETYYKERWIKENDLEQRLLVTFSPKYKHYQETVRKRQIERALKKWIILHH
nr:hypothetical protein [Streptohalobacillus salinus]